MSHSRGVAGRNKVLIISFADDLHTRAVSEWMRKERLGEAVLFDFRDFPIRSEITFRPGSGAILHLPEVGALRLRDIAGVWWRRPQKFTFAPSITDGAVKSFCDVNCRHALQGLFEALGDRVVDPIFRAEAASRKLFQLEVAAQCGLRVPLTCVTNDSRAARRFLQSQRKGAIYKVFAGDETYYSGTCLIEPEDLENLRLVRHCPVIFQEFLKPGFDLRVTIVGAEIFAAKLTSQKPAAQVDIRLDVACTIEPYELPSDVESGIRRLISRLGLRYAAVDLRVDDREEHFFLEVNPHGQYLFVEMATNQPITAALVRLLSDPLRCT